MKKIELFQLNKGNHFMLKRGGRWYTFHTMAIEHHRNGKPSQAREHYVIAVSQGVMYAFYDTRKVITKK